MTESTPAHALHLQRDQMLVRILERRDDLARAAAEVKRIEGDLRIAEAHRRRIAAEIEGMEEQVEELELGYKKLTGQVLARGTHK